MADAGSRWRAGDSLHLAAVLHTRALPAGPKPKASQAAPSANFDFAVVNIREWGSHGEGTAVSSDGTGSNSGKRDFADVFQRSEQMVVALLESASQAIISIDRAGRIVLANRRAEEMFGYTREELMGARIEILLPESRRATHGKEREDYFSKPRIRPMGIGMDLAGRRKDGVEFPVEVSLSNIETAEGFFAIAFVSDISQRKALEQQLSQAQ